MMQKFIYIIFKLVISLMLIILLHHPLSAQQPDDAQEVFLTFRYQNLVSVYTISYYKDGDFFLPHNELFTSLGLHSRIDPAANRLSGEFMETGTYVIDLDRQTATLADIEITFTSDDYIITELDIFLHPDIYTELFGLEFTVDFNNLRLQLISTYTLPIESQQVRERQRQQAFRMHTDPFADFYDLRYERNRHTLNGGFLDYNLSANITQDNNSYLYNTGIGMEILGGDLQGNIFGSWSQQATSLRSSNLRWRYAMHDEEWLTQIIAGQAVSNGLVQSSFSGIQLSNEPLEPRFLFDDYAFEGTVSPESEVELYRNNTLIDYQRADELGQYRFLVPLTYGSSQYDIRIYSPAGQISQRQTRMQVPFHFVPPGEINYTLEAGRLDNPIPGTIDRGFLATGNVRSGITNWLSARGGMEFYQHYHEEGIPTFSGALTGRISTNYLVTVEAASQAFYRVNAGVIYPSSASIDMMYTNFIRQGGVYNPGRNLNNFRFNLFTPFEIGTLPFYFRTTINRDEREQTEIYRYNLNLSTRINRFNFRLGYRDTQIGRLEPQTTSLARLTATTSYTTPRGRTIPNALRGTLLRLRTSYATALNKFEDLEFQASRSILRRGRLQLTAGRNFLGQFNYLSANLSIDFDSFRSNSVTRLSRGRGSLTQSLRGSVGYDSGNQHILTSNRQQVGRSAVGVRMFVDHNNSGRYQEGDELIGEQAIRIERAGSAVNTENGITYLSQLQPYRQYNMTVNKNAIRNPLLVPLIENFSFVSDPNQYKIIDIPLYMSGVIEGQVQRDVNGTLNGVAGLRLILEQTDSPEGNVPFRTELRTFSDGSFYAYETHPGFYELKVDSSQLELLNVVSVPEKLEIEIKATAEGDYIEGLGFILKPADFDEVDSEGPVDGKDIDPEDKETEELILDELPGVSDMVDFEIRESGNCNYMIQFGSYRGLNLSLRIAEGASKQFGQPVHLYYNENTSMYALRTEPMSSLTGSLDLYRKLKQLEPQHQYAVASECPGRLNEYSVIPLSLLILFDTFQNTDQADELAKQLNAEFNLDLNTRYLNDEDIYLLYDGPFEEIQTATNKLEELASLPLPVEPELIGDPETLNKMDFGFRLQKGTYNDESGLAGILGRCENKLNEYCYILRDEEGYRYIFIDREFTAWAPFLGFYESVHEKSGTDKLIIHIINEHP